MACTVEDILALSGVAQETALVDCWDCLSITDQNLLNTILGSASVGAGAVEVVSEVQVVRLDGSLAVAATPFINFTAGTAGNTYSLVGPYRSFSAVWLPATNIGASFTINGVSYLAGVGAGTAFYVSLLPGVINNGGIEVHNGTILFTAGAGAFVEIGITILNILSILLIKQHQEQADLLIWQVFRQSRPTRQNRLIQ
jgi:hypothetical protein